MAPTKTAGQARRPHNPPSAAQTRIIEAALREFARNGVGGTSLQMIADEIGVTKAAVYHQYKTKDAIVRAVASAEYDRLETVLDLAESEEDEEQARAVALTGIIDLAVEGRREMSTILTDPHVGRLLARDKRPGEIVRRLNHLLVGPQAGPDSEIATIMLSAAISGAVMHPMAIRRDDETLRTQLRTLAERFLGIC
ncbi:MAG TPA: helix-turn-helix domain-containing protein [Acidimicrobiales bacterium]|nr:helix-turn-helix domain-containing protein [Acidimicrobiales bacterium]